nr:MAG TPA: hypothetical protein [Caudoviricetes sp.]
MVVCIYYLIATLLQIAHNIATLFQIKLTNKHIDRLSDGMI